MRKTVFFCAALAVVALTTLSSCSSDDEQVSSPSLPSDTGIPFRISATVDNSGLTRATDVSSLKYFQLYGYDDAATDTKWWINNSTVSNTSGSTWEVSGDVGNWKTTGANDFYAVSNNSQGGPTITDNITASQSFTYTVPGAVGSQEDLLVGYTSGSSATGASLILKHALGAITGLKLNFNAAITGTPDVGTTYKMIVKSITFHNLATSGTFTFAKDADAPGSWSTSVTDGWASATKSDITISFSASQSFSYTVPAGCPSNDNSATGFSTDWEINLSDYVYLLPQQGITAWAPTVKSGTTYNEADDNAYVTVKCVLYSIDKDDDYDTTLVSADPEDAPDDESDALADAGGDIYIPFKASAIAFNHGYTLRLPVVNTLTSGTGGLKRTFAGATVAF